MHAALSPRGTTLIVSLILTATFFTLSGCSTLGIATTKEMESVQSWQDSTGRVVADMDQRMATIDNVAADLERLELESTAALDSLEIRVKYQFGVRLTRHLFLPGREAFLVHLDSPA